VAPGLLRCARNDGGCGDMRGQTCASVLAARCVRGMREHCPSNQKRAQGMPDARCTRSRLCNKKHRRQQLQVHRNNRHSLRNGFNGVLRALPGDRACLPPSSVDSTTDLAPASGRQNHTTSPSAKAVFVRATNCAQHSRVHRIPLPTSVTIAIRPSHGCRVRT
jgi:hypothetical protein